jgi:hypothetical protein
MTIIVIVARARRDRVFGEDQFRRSRKLDSREVVTGRFGKKGPPFSMVATDRGGVDGTEDGALSAMTDSSLNTMELVEGSEDESSVEESPEA